MYTLGILYTLYVCVCSAHRQVLLDLRRASRPLCKGSAILNCIQHSRMRSSRWSLCYYSQLLMGQDHHAIAYDQARLSSVDNTYDGPLLSNTPQ